MPSSNLKSLIGKLNDTCRRALESAAGLCLSQTHYEVDLEHFLIKLLEMSQTDFQQILRYFEINQDRLTADLTRAMEGFKTGNARTPALSPRIPRMVQEAWLLASIDYQASAVRSGHILLALMSSDELARMLIESSPGFKQISVEKLRENLTDLIAGSEEDKEVGPTPAAGGLPGQKIATAGTKALDQFTINLTDRADRERGARLGGEVASRRRPERAVEEGVEPGRGSRGRRRPGAFVARGVGGAFAPGGGDSMQIDRGRGAASLGQGEFERHRVDLDAPAGNRVDERGQIERDQAAPTQSLVVHAREEPLARAVGERDRRGFVERRIERGIERGDLRRGARRQRAGGERDRGERGERAVDHDGLLLHVVERNRTYARMEAPPATILGFRGSVDSREACAGNPAEA